MRLTALGVAVWTAVFLASGISPAGATGPPFDVAARLDVPAEQCRRDLPITLSLRWRYDAPLSELPGCWRLERHSYTPDLSISVLFECRRLTADEAVALSPEVSCPPSEAAPVCRELPESCRDCDGDGVNECRSDCELVPVYEFVLRDRCAPIGIQTYVLSYAATGGLGEAWIYRETHGPAEPQWRGEASARIGPAPGFPCPFVACVLDGVVPSQGTFGAKSDGGALAPSSTGCAVGAVVSAPPPCWILLACLLLGRWPRRRRQGARRRVG